MSIKVPIDDIHTKRYTVMADLMLEGPSDRPAGNGSGGTVEYRQERISKSLPNAIHPFATYSVDGVQPQDFMVLETKGPIAAGAEVLLPRPAYCSAASTVAAG